MSEVRFLEKTNNNKQTKVSIQSSERLAYTGESKYGVKATVKGKDKEREISLIRHDAPFADSIVEAWRSLKEVGIPVVPTLRTSGNTIYSTDLKADGSEFYGKSKLRQVEEENNYGRRKIDDLFIDLTSEDTIQKVHKRAVEIATIANRNGILLANDDTFDLRVSPQGEFEVYCLDLSGTKKYQVDKYKPEILSRDNLLKAESFIKLLRSIREKLLEKKQESDVQAKDERNGHLSSVAFVRKAIERIFFPSKSSQ